MIVIPMAGMSSRFKKAGYGEPKYQLEIKGTPLFDYCVRSFESYFDTERFVFVVRDEEAKHFVVKRCKTLKILHLDVVVLVDETRGQAETVYLGLEAIKECEGSEQLLIFNIDTIRTNFSFPEAITGADGYLEVFVGEGDGWSFVAPGKDGEVLKTTEKIRISNLCSTGLYYFARLDTFMGYCKQLLATSPRELQGGEYYIAPMYNELISNGLNIQYHEINKKDVIFSGIPAEYEALLKTPEILNR